MGFERNVGDPLNLKYKLSPSSLGTGLFARAFLTDRTGAALATLDLSEIAPGVYAENSFTMPNTAQVVARFQAYRDAGFTQEACEFPDTIDIFELSNFDPSTLVKPPAQIFANISQANIKGVAHQPGAVVAETQIKQDIQGKVLDDEIKAVIQESGSIEGVVDDK